MDTLQRIENLMELEAQGIDTSSEQLDIAADIEKEYPALAKWFRDRNEEEMPTNTY